VSVCFFAVNLPVRKKISTTAFNSEGSRVGFCNLDTRRLAAKKLNNLLQVMIISMCILILQVNTIPPGII
jgi:hypothetical protein